MDNQSIYCYSIVLGVYMKILAMGAHPDDVELSCFGTLARCVNRGDTVVVCSLTNGNLGHKYIDKEKLSLVRMVESVEASKVIGASFCTLDIADGSVDEHDEDQILKVTNLIRSIKPDVIITHSEDEYHRDHIETSKLVFHSSMLASLPSFTSQYPSITHIPHILYMEGIEGAYFTPQIFVDVSETFELKMKGVGCHTSQLHTIDDEDYVDIFHTIEVIASFRGLQCKSRVAEAFRSCDKRARLNYRILP